MAKRILIVTNLYPPQELGGYGRCMADFAWGLMRLGYQIVVASSDAAYLGPQGPSPSGEIIERKLILKGTFENGLNFLKDANKINSINQWNNEKLKEIIREQKFDGILLGNLDLIGPEILSVLIKTKLPIVHHIGFISAPYPIHSYPTEKNYKMVCASQAVKSSMIREGFPISNEPVIYPGARVELFGEESLRRNLPPINTFSQGKQAQLGTSTNPLSVCFAGLLMGSKGAHTVVEALIGLKESGVYVNGMIAGASFQSGYREALEGLLRKAGLEDIVIFTGNLNREQLARMLILHRVGIFPSIYPEAFGIVGAEMQASGLLLITSGVGGASELVEDGKTGLIFNPGDSRDLANKLKMLIQDPKLLEKVSQAGKLQVNEFFSVKNSCLQLQSIFSSYSS
ncbi:glycosyltransferase family 4 protein [Prochlorococcus sp. MIT 1300]|uniref:glycosyltransferase family 4 protein n=1 Tax=Prochlorococcus sp. MIT 1300 TaxID=3096218 RepID=UPI002A74B6C0|nr:glycosyltransferase family 4 protein [Prochlorococcus sp. MIT 1300]